MSLAAFIAQLWKYIRPYRWPVLFILIGLVVELGYEAGLRYSLKFLVDGAIINRDMDMFVRVFAVLGIGGAVYAAFCVACDYYWAKYGVMVINDLCHDLFTHMQALPVGYYDRKSTGDLMARFTSDSAIVDNALVIALPTAFVSVGELFFSSAILFYLNSLLFGGMLAGILASLLSPKLLAGKTGRANYALREYIGQISAYLQENLSAQKTIRAYGLETHASANYRQRLDGFTAVASRAYFLSYVSQRLPNLAFLALNILLMCAGGLLAMRGELSVGALVAYQVIFVGMSSAINHMTWAIPSLMEASAAMRRIREIFDEEALTPDATGESHPPRFSGRVEYRNVGFAYAPEKPVINNLSFSIQPGCFAVFVGPSGAGKTSVGNLLLRFYEPVQGQILLDGIDIRTIHPAALRSQIGVVSQDKVLFNISIAANIRLGKPNASQAELEQAAKAAEIHDFILSLPQQYETRCGEAGGLLSGGECQRIALARALVRKPALLLLDEATSALDPIAEQGILKTLQKLRGQCTIIAITHKLTLAIEADVIFVMVNGSLQGQGSHAELLSDNRLYRQFWNEK